MSPQDSIEQDRRERLSRVRRTVSERLTTSWRTVPMVTVHTEAGAGVMADVRQMYKAHGRTPPPMEAMAIYAVAPLLDEWPELNACVDGEEAVYYARRDIGVATDTPAGLMLPVVRGADGKSLDELTDEVVPLMDAARNRKLCRTRCPARRSPSRTSAAWEGDT